MVDDASIRAHLLAELEKVDWARTGLTNIVVLNGVIQLWGVITDEAQRKLIFLAAQQTPGARAVEDHLMLVQPSTFEALMS